jgi:hypothetical protein
MLTWAAIYIAKIRQEEMLREAQQARLVRETLRHRMGDQPQNLHALAWLGKKLVIWGSNLERRYGPSRIPLHKHGIKPVLVED